MIHARIPISRTTDGRWQALSSTMQLSPERRVPIPATPPEDTLADVVETSMGEALLCLDRHRRGTTEPIAWEILVEDMPYCYRCVDPMQPSSASAGPPGSLPSGTWRCLQCGVAIDLDDDAES